jgi:hypothetical protein
MNIKEMLRKPIILLLIFLAILIVAVYFFTKYKQKSNITESLQLNFTENITITSIINDKNTKISTVRPESKIYSSYYNASFLSERKFVEYGKSIILDVEVYRYENSTERARITSKFLEDNTNRFFVNIKTKEINGWSVNIFDFRNIVDGEIVGWGSILEKDDKTIYFISAFPANEAEKEEVIKWTIERF